MKKKDIEELRKFYHKGDAFAIGLLTVVYILIICWGWSTPYPLFDKIFGTIVWTGFWGVICFLWGGLMYLRYKELKK